MGKQYYPDDDYKYEDDYMEEKGKKNKGKNYDEEEEYECYYCKAYKPHCEKCHFEECPEKRNIDKEIKETFKEIAKVLCDIDKDIVKLNKLFCKLEKLLVEKGCLTQREKALICNIRKDIQALNCVLKETAKDIRCLEELVL